MLDFKRKIRNIKELIRWLIAPISVRITIILLRLELLKTIFFLVLFHGKGAFDRIGQKMKTSFDFPDVCFILIITVMLGHICKGFSLTRF